MAIRIRKIDGVTVALCANKTKPVREDIYLDDNAHHALTTKFSLDFHVMGFLKESLGDKKLVKLTSQQEQSND